MRPAKRKCAEPGCFAFVEGVRCEKHQKREDKRPNSNARGYDADWRRTSEAYRQRHPLCVRCELRGKVRKAKCVDHIIPIECVPSLKYDPENWAGYCLSCHSFKTPQEPKAAWEPDRSRVVVCGLPGVGKTTWAKGRECVPYFDADELRLSGWEAIVFARNRWIAEHAAGPCTVVVASTVTASTLAYQLRGVVKHLTRVHRPFEGLTPGRGVDC